MTFKLFSTLLAAMAMAFAPAVRAADGPAARAHHSGVYDAARGEFLIYGGFTYDGGVKRLGDLWAWNGKTWRFVAESGVPKAVPGLAYDSKRDRVLMFGGQGEGAANTNTNDGRLSVLEGTHWRILTEEASMARIGAGLVYDSVRDRMVLFGGRNGEVELADTWEWDGGKWNQTWMSGPSLRDPTAMTYDSGRGVVVLYGGFRPLAALGDTWEWDGHAWRQVAENGPGARAWPGLAYDSQNRRTILFGGEDGAGHFYNDTWEWDGKTWVRRAVTGALPPARIQFVMVYNARRARTVLFGGMDEGGRYLNDVWEFDGRRWEKKFP